MEIKLIVAIIRGTKLQAVEETCKALGVERVNASKVKGYGEYRNVFTSDWMGDEVRMEIFTRQHKSDAIARAIVEAAHTGVPGDGVVAVIPVDRLYLIRTKGEATPESFWPKPPD